MARQVPRRVTIPAGGGALLIAQEHLPQAPLGPDLPTLVLAHGWTLCRAAWRPIIEAVHASHPLRIVTYDHRGHGESTMGDEAEASVPELARDLDAVIRALAPEGRLVLGGHSMGGMAIMAYAGQFHTELKARVNGVVLVSTAASVAGRRPIPLEGLVMAVSKRMPAIGPGPLVPVGVQGRMMFGKGARQEDVLETVRMIQHTKMPTIGRYFDAISGHDEIGSLAHFVDVPTHVMVGDQDRLTPVSHGRRLAQEISGARFTELPGLGHMLPYEATDVVAQALAAYFTYDTGRTRHAGRRRSR